MRADRWPERRREFTNWVIECYWPTFYSTCYLGHLNIVKYMGRPFIYWWPSLPQNETDNKINKQTSRTSSKGGVSKTKTWMLWWPYCTTSQRKQVTLYSCSFWLFTELLTYTLNITLTVNEKNNGQTGHKKYTWLVQHSIWYYHCM